MNKQLDQILQQRMDRKNFLKNVVLGVVMMTGAAGLVKTFHQPAAQPEQQTGKAKAQGMAYGGSAYGGVKQTT